MLISPRVALIGAGIVVGLYMNPPGNAVVFSFDKKSQIQALQRAQPILPMDIGPQNDRATTTSATARSICSHPERGDGRGACRAQAEASGLADTSVKR
jgi:hypothetical protein